MAAAVPHRGLGERPADDLGGPVPEAAEHGDGAGEDGEVDLGLGEERPELEPADRRRAHRRARPTSSARRAASADDQRADHRGRPSLKVAAQPTDQGDHGSTARKAMALNSGSCVGLRVHGELTQAPKPRTAKAPMAPMTTPRLGWRLRAATGTTSAIRPSAGAAKA